MRTSFKPANYNSLSPYLILDDAERFIDLMKAIFDAQLLRRYDHEDGTIMHAELMLDDSVIMFSSSSTAYQATTTILHLYVPDVYESFTKAIEMGCESIEAPVIKKGDPDTRGTFRDFAGNLWSVSTQANT